MSNDEQSQFNLEYYLSELNCYEQLHYQKFTHLYDIKKSAISAPLTLLIHRASRNTNCKSRFLADEIGKKTGLPVELVDERLSTVQAQMRLHESGHDARSSKGKIDSASAAVLLQAWLDGRRRD